jgi:5-methylcytosine-specific restriction protein A
MTWTKTPADRARDAETYGSPEYRRNRPLALRRAGGRCELTQNGHRCGSRNRVSVDHIKPVSQGGTHHLDNLRVLCRPCHLAKTATEGGGFRQPGRRSTRAADPPLQQRTQW